jgi:enamine deaminase RidA (YjgF/YER057c/UK114 family)
MTTKKTLPTPFEQVFNQPGYSHFATILKSAYDQAATGKGKERHANDLPFDEQPMQKLIALHGVGFAAGQVGKKLTEAQGMLVRGEVQAATREILGAIVYAAGMQVYIDNHMSEFTDGKKT